MVPQEFKETGFAAEQRKISLAAAEAAMSMESTEGKQVLDSDSVATWGDSNNLPQALEAGLTVVPMFAGAKVVGESKKAWSMFNRVDDVPPSGTMGGGSVVTNKTYSGNVYDPDFVGAVQWEYFYRGDATPRKNFLSSMSQRDGVATTDNFLDNLPGGARSEILAEHGVSSATSPYISTSRNPVVAKYFARGPGQAQDGYLTTFRIKAREAKLLQDQGQIVPNVENPMSFFEPNPSIGVPEAEFLFRNNIDPRYIYQQIPVRQ